MIKYFKHSHGRYAAKALMVFAAIWSIFLPERVSAASSPVAITVLGSIVDNTCTVEKVQGVDLPPVSLRDFAGKGSTLGRKAVSVTLQNCGKDITRGVQITTDGFADMDDTEGYAFKNAVSGKNAASGVGLRFYKSTDNTKPFKVKDEVGEMVFDLTPNATNTLEFAAAYVVTDVAKLAAGDFATTVYLRLAYQ